MPYKDEEKKKEYHKKYTKEWRDKNRERYNKNMVKWQHDNPEKTKAYARKTYTANREKIIASKMKGNMKRYRRLRIEALEHYSNGVPTCACCGETIIQFLAIDHMNGGGKQHRIELRKKNQNIFEYLRKEGYPEGYRVLCHNCNMSYGFYGFCPHQGEINEEKI